MTSHFQNFSLSPFRPGRSKSILTSFTQQSYSSMFAMTPIVPRMRSFATLFRKTFFPTTTLEAWNVFLWSSVVLSVVSRSRRAEPPRPIDVDIEKGKTEGCITVLKRAGIGKEKIKGCLVVWKRESHLMNVQGGWDLLSIGRGGDNRGSLAYKCANSAYLLDCLYILTFATLSKQTT
jgi:hypothetical protein